MTNQLGPYIGGGNRHLPQSVIQKMKKNMRKVPVIQEKSDKYHLSESEEAERIINEKLTKQEMIDNKGENLNIEFGVLNKKRNGRQKMINRLKNLFY